ncbi:MAG: DEAD/DEAH box helicase [Vicinamibacteria bacterium]|nr:DEAD/DEAH box helicase [Vicinamibacteria bacterium]
MPRKKVGKRTRSPLAARQVVSAAEPLQIEALDTLMSLAYRKTGHIPEDVLASHVLSVTAGADWTVKRAAMEALLRRMAFAGQDGLAVATRPGGGELQGFYTTRRAGSRERPYTTLLSSVNPPRGSCGCPDFIRSSLGLCKHLLAILDDLYSRPRRMRRIRENGAATVHPAMTWDPVRPLTGPGDALERLRFQSNSGTIGRSRDPMIRKWFRDGNGRGYLIKRTYADDPPRRIEMIDALLHIVSSSRAVGRGRIVEPGILPLLRQERERLERMNLSVTSNAGMRQALRGLKRGLYKYQREGVARFLSAGRLLLADDMGLGKTAQAAAACHALFATQRVRRGLVIVPASLKDQWRREWRMVSDAPIDVVDGSPEARRTTYRKRGHGFLIANYEQVLRDLEAMHAFKPDIIVLDEAQRIKNWATKTAAYVKRLSPAYRLVLTGTPMENRLEELASIMDWVDDFALEPKWRLAPLHAQLADGRKEIVGVRHLDTLRKRMNHCVLRRVRGEVLSQLPARTDTVVPVVMTDEQLEAHAELDQPIARLAHIARRRPLTQAEFLRLMTLLTTQRIIANGLAQLRFQEVWPTIASRSPEEVLMKSLSMPKLGELREIVSQVAVQQRRKMVVFSQWRRMLSLAHWAVGELLRESGLRAAFFTGQEGQRRRTQNIVEFHDDPRLRLLFATDAGGVGLNLQRAASCCINLDLPWNPAVLEQRISRIHRLGQRRPIDVYNLVSQASIEARIAGLVADKKAFFTGLFDGDSNEIRFDRSTSFLSRLECLVEPAKAPELAAHSTEASEAESPAEPEIERVVTAADESRDVPGEMEAPAPSLTGALPPASEIRGLFSKLAIRPGEDGGIHIDAPPEAAAGLAALFEGMARMLRIGQ